MRARSDAIDSVDLAILQEVYRANQNGQKINMNQLTEVVPRTYVAIRNRVARLADLKLMYIEQGRYTGDLYLTPAGVQKAQERGVKQSVYDGKPAAASGSLSVVPTHARPTFNRTEMKQIAFGSLFGKVPTTSSVPQPPTQQPQAAPQAQPPVQQYRNGSFLSAFNGRRIVGVGVGVPQRRVTPQPQSITQPSTPTVASPGNVIGDMLNLASSVNREEVVEQPAPGIVSPPLDVPNETIIVNPTGRKTQEKSAKAKSDGKKPDKKKEVTPPKPKIPISEINALNDTIRHLPPRERRRQRDIGMEELGRKYGLK